MSAADGIATGSVFRREGARRPVWYGRYRLPDGRQVQKRIGPAWTERARPAAGYDTKRTARSVLRDLLYGARIGVAETSAFCSLKGIARIGTESRRQARLLVIATAAYHS
ncbi:MAG: hypothetical protein ABI427_09200, partial [Solirubrobacteraceae bacterium]